MASYNKVILAGNITRDPQLSQMPSGDSVCEIGIATNRKYKSKDGSTNEEVTFVDVKVYGKQAEVINQYFSKGKPILIEGRLKYDTWEGKDGGKRSKLYVIMERFEFMGGGESSNGQAKQAVPPAAVYAGSDIPF